MERSPSITLTGNPAFPSSSNLHSATHHARPSPLHTPNPEICPSSSKTKPPSNPLLRHPEAVSWTKHLLGRDLTLIAFGHTRRSGPVFCGLSVEVGLFPWNHTVLLGGPFGGHWVMETTLDLAPSWRNFAVRCHGECKSSWFVWMMELDEAVLRCVVLGCTCLVRWSKEGGYRTYCTVPSTLS